MLTYNYLYVFLKEYGLAIFEVAAVVFALWLGSYTPQIKRLLKWAGEAKYVAVGSAVIVAGIVFATIFVSLWPKSTELIIRHTGLTLQNGGDVGNLCNL